MKLTPQQIEFFNREGWLFLPELFSQEEVDYLAREAVKHLRRRPPGGLAREERRAAHRLCRASLQRGVRRCSARIRA